MLKMNAGSLIGRKLLAGEKSANKSVVLRLEADESKKMTINFTAAGMSERELVELGWWYDLDEEAATARYLKNHSVRDILAGDNKNVIPHALYVDEFGDVFVKFDVKRNLKVRDLLYSNFGRKRVIFDVIVWKDEIPKEKYIIDTFCDGVTISKFVDRDEIGAWTVSSEPLLIYRGMGYIEENI